MFEPKLSVVTRGLLQNRQGGGEQSPQSMRLNVLKFLGDDPDRWIFAITEYFSLLNTPADQHLRIVEFNLEGAAAEWFQWMSRNGLTTTWARFEESVKNHFGPSKYEDPRGALSKLLQLGTVEDYQWEFKKLMNRVTDIPDSLLISFYISGLKLNLQHELLVSRPTTLGDAFSLARITEARFEAIAEKEQNIKEKADTTLTLPSEEASPVVKGPLDASEDTLLSLRSEDPNFKIQEKAVEYVRALNAAPLEVVFAGPVDEVRGKFAEFSEDKGCVEKVLSATKLPEGGNSHSAYSPYHLEGKVIFEGVRNVTPWAADGGRRKGVKCYVQGSGRRKRKKVIGHGSGRRFVMGLDNHHTYMLSRICVSRIRKVSKVNVYLVVKSIVKSQQSLFRNVFVFNVFDYLFRKVIIGPWPV
ncbi:class II heat shock protein [Tanacetum coccineum]